MKRALWIAAAFAVALLIMFVFGPSLTTSEVDFRKGSVRVIVVALVVAGVMLIATPWVTKPSLGRGPVEAAHRSTADVAMLGTPYVLAVIGVVGALATLLVAQMALLRYHVDGNRVTIVAVALQQAIFALAAVLIYRVKRNSGSFRSAFLSLIVVTIFSNFFALASPTVLPALAQNLQSAPIVYTNLAFAIPVTLIAIFAITKMMTFRR